jgi:hypothetical protein
MPIKLNIKRVDFDENKFFAKIKDQLKRNTRLQIRVANSTGVGLDYGTNYLTRVLSKNPVITSLVRRNPVDLQAEFGINAEAAGEAAKDIRHAMTENFKVS